MQSPQAKLGYLHLQTHPEVSIAELQRTGKAGEPSLCGIPGALLERWLVEGDAERFAAR